MIEMLVAVAITMLVLVVVVPLTVVFLLVRQVRRSRAFRRLRAARARVHTAPVRAAAGGAAPLLRPWNRLATDAAAARDRFAATVAQTPAGPLRSRLNDVLGEVDEAVNDAQRLAREGSNADRARREVSAALARQRKRNRSAGAASVDLAHDLLVSTRAQQASADRLGEASRQTLCQLQLVVARLEELTAHTLELTMGTPLPHQRVALSSIADHVAALREATAEVEELHARVAL